MNRKLTSVASRFDALTLRERALVALSVIALVWLAWDWTLHQTLNRRLTAAHGDVTSLQERIVSEVAVADQLKQRARRRSEQTARRPSSASSPNRSRRSMRASSRSLADS